MMLIEKAKTRKDSAVRFKLYDAYEFLQNTVDDELGFAGYILQPDWDSELASKVQYEWCTNKNLRKVENWIVKNIFLQLNDLHPKTKDVRIRIATSMLNNLVNNNQLEKELSVYIHEAFVDNLSKVWFDLEVESLPF